MLAGAAGFGEGLYEREVTPTFMTEAEYDTGWRAAMDTILCDWNLLMAGVKETNHVQYAVNAVESATREEYLERAYALGRQS